VLLKVIIFSFYNLGKGPGMPYQHVPLKKALHYIYTYTLHIHIHLHITPTLTPTHYAYIYQHQKSVD